MSVALAWNRRRRLADDLRRLLAFEEDVLVLSSNCFLEFDLVVEVVWFDIAVGFKVSDGWCGPDLSISRRTFLLNWRGQVEFETYSLLGRDPLRLELFFLLLIWILIIDDLHDLCAVLTAKWATSFLASVTWLRNQRSRLVRHIVFEILEFRIRRQAASAQEALVLNDIVELVRVLPCAVPSEFVCRASNRFTADGAVLSVVLWANLVAEVLSCQVERLVHREVAPINWSPRLIGHKQTTIQFNSKIQTANRSARMLEPETIH